jgi:hypothetical protein
MGNKMCIVTGLSCIAATVTIALAQTSVCFKYGMIDTDQPGPLQPPGGGCFAYVECPTGFRCLTGNKDKKVSNPFTSTVDCTHYSGGAGTPLNCSLGTPTFPQPAAGVVAVPDQTCGGGCLSGPPA